MKKHILFVGQDQTLCRELQAGCAGPQSDWSVQHVLTEEEALALCQEQAFAAVVADANLSGKDVLDAFMRRQPKALRVIVSDLADVESTMKCIGQAHHHLLKPCSARTLMHALEQALAQDAWLPNEAVRGLITQMRQVPSPLKAYTQIVQEMKSPSCSLEKIADLVGQDPAVAAKVLQLANSAVFGLEMNATHPAEAIGYIGLEATKAVVLLAHTFSSFDGLKLARFSIEDLWRHSVQVGQMARRVALLEDAGEEMAEQAFAAGLLHDLGKLMFAANHPGIFTKVLNLAHEQYCNLWEAEEQVLPGAGHAELGASVLRIWGLPPSLTEAVALHHNPWCQRARTFSPLTAVHVANILDHENHPDSTVILPSQINTSYLMDMGLDGRLEAWRKACQQPARPADMR